MQSHYFLRKVTNSCVENGACFLKKTTDISEKMTDNFSPSSERKKEKMKEWRVEKE